PQLVTSVAVVAQVVPHTVCPAGHDNRQVPATHTWPEAQAWPQPPQLTVSTWVSTQRPLHTDSSEGHVSTSGAGGTSRCASTPRSEAASTPTTVEPLQPADTTASNIRTPSRKRSLSMVAWTSLRPSVGAA